MNGVKVQDSVLVCITDWNITDSYKVSVYMWMYKSNITKNIP